MDKYVNGFLNFHLRSVKRNVKVRWRLNLNCLYLNYILLISQHFVVDDSELDKDILDISLNRLNLSESLSSSGRSRHSSSECSNSDYNVEVKKRNHLLSETSDASSDSSGDFSGQEVSFKYFSRILN